MSRFQILLSMAFSSLLLAPSSWGHGEDKLGPNGGYIRMPSNFHTEIVPKGDSQFQVYLLDIQFANPTVDKSQLKVLQKVKGQEYPVTCQVAGTLYSCTLAKGQTLKAGELVIESERMGQRGVAVTYPLPLTLVKKETGHHHH